MKMAKDGDDDGVGVLAGNRLFHESLDWLVEHGLVELKGEDEDGNPLWGLTEAGSQFCAAPENAAFVKQARASRKAG
jgi:hypothetical protein